MVMTAPGGTETAMVPTASPQLATVLCGTFHREPRSLDTVHAELAHRYLLLSPPSVGWLDPDATFVRLPSEADESGQMIEARHLDAISRADFVWLFCPDGYVGSSAAMEVGYANAIGIPVLSDTPPSDETIASMVRVIAEGVSAVPTVIHPEPGSGLRACQRYYSRAAARRGWSEESARDTMLLLTEEVGELARAVRKTAGLARAGGYEDTAIGEELADVQLYLLHLANVTGVDLAAAVTQKERINTARHANGHRAA